MVSLNCLVDVGILDHPFKLLDATPIVGLGQPLKDKVYILRDFLNFLICPSHSEL
jgi:hypothetical protein